MQAKRIVPVRRPLCKGRLVRIFSASSGGFCIVALDKVPAHMVLVFTTDRRDLSVKVWPRSWSIDQVGGTMSRSTSTSRASRHFEETLVVSRNGRNGAPPCSS